MICFKLKCISLLDNCWAAVCVGGGGLKGRNHFLLFSIKALFGRVAICLNCEVKG